MNRLQCMLEVASACALCMLSPVSSLAFERPTVDSSLDSADDAIAGGNLPGAVKLLRDAVSCQDGGVFFGLLETRLANVVAETRAAIGRSDRSHARSLLISILDYESRQPSLADKVAEFLSKHPQPTLRRLESRWWLRERCF